MNKRNQYSAEFKTKVVLEVLREKAPINEIACKYSISPVVVSRCINRSNAYRKPVVPTTSKELVRVPAMEAEGVASDLLQFSIFFPDKVKPHLR